jgi:molybdate transport system ATP-binding protein
MTATNEIHLRIERDGFDLAVDLAWDERVAVIFGPSGSGKSTLFEAVLGMHPRVAPRIRLGGVDLDLPSTGHHLPMEARGLGWVPQDALLFPHLDVEGNLRAGLPRAGVDGEGYLARAIEVLEIGDLLSRSPQVLSGGERQRVAIARALASGPRALLLDEPLASLDVSLRARVLPYLLKVRDALDLPILHITHDPDEAMLVGDIVIVLDQGRVVATGSPAEVLWSRAVLPLSEALGIENVLSARVSEANERTVLVESAGGTQFALAAPLPVAPGDELRLGLRAQDILISADLPGRISARNVLPARVVRCESEGGSTLVYLDAGDALVAKVTPAAVEALSLTPGTEVHLLIKAQALRRLG